MNSRILILHDDSRILEILASKLEADGYEVAAVSDAEEGLLLAHKDRPGLILLDLGMLGEAGLSVYEQLRAAGLTKSVPVIFVTAHPREQSRDKVLARSNGDPVAQPVNADGLFRKVIEHFQPKSSQLPAPKEDESGKTKKPRKKEVTTVRKAPPHGLN